MKNIKLNLKRNALVILGLFIVTTAFTQDRYFVYGKLFDKITSEPVVFASIVIKNKAIGVISNEDGVFRIPLKFQEIGDTLVISSMGYGSKEIVLSNLVVETINRIALTPMLMELQEVTVMADNSRGKRKKKLSPKEIIQKAIVNIPENYPTAANSYVGYYRDYQLKEGSYYNLNEAIVEVFDKGFGYNDFETTNVGIFNYKQNLDFPRDTLANKQYNYKNKSKVIPNSYVRSYGGNEFVIMRIMDAIRNYNTTSYSYVDKLDEDFIKNHVLRLEDDVFIDGKKIFSIAITRNDGATLANGTIYIAKDNFAIHKLNYAVYDLPEKSSIRNRLDYKGNKEDLLYQVRVEYKENNNLMYPNYVSFNNSFKIKEPPAFKVDMVKIKFEEKHIEVYFNKEPKKFPSVNNNVYNPSNTDNYWLSYKGEKIKLLNVTLMKENKAILYPGKKGRSSDLFTDGIALFNKDELRLHIKNVKDIDNNEINESKVYKSNQFREFFLQKINSKVTFPADSLYMIKNRPIFENQPLAAPQGFEDYWMNTPLQNIK
ncbi:carboxypeptidase-like regulatory domain-containing protein [Cellulophaga sp. F20128]|uniref:carboxypeptidase-like regulatory domain-containing protein n=1 Tax=Cellulophaga sp. F20128 TaxID=2926413 RepID=UPI001FF27D75|nr:carboxypeptidase-like regulatory domain-containing protein [Cellulophaga sp. F20128]MCK0156569.1 carboxypeptidase-like regulatory domain-containing protein [Cellulophaga sp. F20128]